MRRSLTRLKIMTTSWSLTNRIFLATALMAIPSIGLAIYVVNVAVTRQAEDELRRGLEAAATLVDRNRDLVGFSLDEQLAARLKQLTASDIAFVVDGAVQASTLPTEYSRTLADAAQGSREATLRLGNDEYVAVTRALSTSSAFEGIAGTRDDGGASGIAPVAIVLRSQIE